MQQEIFFYTCDIWGRREKLQEGNKKLEEKSNFTFSWSLS